MVFEYLSSFEEIADVVVRAGGKEVARGGPREAADLLSVDFNLGEEFHVAVPAVKIDLFLGHPFNGIVVDVPDFISD